MSRIFASKCCNRSRLRRCSSLLARQPHAAVATSTVAATHQPQLQQQQQQRRWAHTVRLIALEDLPFGKAYKGDVVTVKAGYARNHLVPQRLALYATPQNFERLGIVDPDFESEEERIARLQRESNMTAAEDKYLKDADLLKKYLKNKVLQIRRNVDPNSNDALHPGIVTADHIREKLSRQLKIDLDQSEHIHILRTASKDDPSSATSASVTTTNPLNFADLDEAKIQALADELVPVVGADNKDGKCSIRINRLGEYLAVIGLKGGYAIPLRLLVRPRA
mmetsp:Transcript_13305/g.27901  ORF Transcript_13305/g.27901 Transcript_13305/m.27901 type:complete len:279 (-) Transcript_13305:279-1115(-)|eukprot:CAMPEP_0168191554 /NCGR_PEP_ID=MMETSP0139_2-20121125/17580_1 /TAXON_ID=44445 /ORGANISM="Pseudo-nitzschia australis, Strain 10249 10 AB" /LENGTH=278 /DNA_ID=CAMNT_0008114741 /DNA_START=35 /DNA_END=871 /DNA_ORIENTATION=+